MKKIFLYSLLTIAVTGFIASNASAAAFTNNTGGLVTITVANVPTAAGSLTFNPSTNVGIRGGSSQTSFAMASYHLNVVGKKAAQAYGMAADSNKQFVLDISNVGDTVAASAQLAAADTNSATAFPGTGTPPWVSI